MTDEERRRIREAGARAAGKADRGGMLTPEQRQVLLRTFGILKPRERSSPAP